MNRNRFRPKVTRRVPKTRALEIPPDRCERCTRPITPAKYHDCGEQLPLFPTPRRRAAKK